MARTEISKADVDFDNFSLEKERADAIRAELDRVRQSGWLDDFKLLVAELGVEDPNAAGGNAQLELIMNGAKVYRGPAERELQDLLVILADSELHVRWKNSSLLEILSLPKAGEYAVLHADPIFFELEALLKEGLQDDLKQARGAKSSRQAHFKSFGKSAS
ncbi:MAG: hypothetical protein JST16_13090 [Bdellovibrionales bacterium]|nr:hypothetical protein [Bdellovibrionales bacterium]